MTFRRLSGRGPRYTALAVVSLAALFYPSAHDMAEAAAYDPKSGSEPPPYAPPDGVLDTVQICATKEGQPRRVPDEWCEEANPGDAQHHPYQWVWANLPYPPVAEHEYVTGDEESTWTEYASAPDTDDGGLDVIAVGYFVPSTGPTRYYYQPPRSTSPDRVVRGLSPAGGTITKSGGGTAGADGGGRLIARAASVARAGSPAAMLPGHRVGTTSPFGATIRSSAGRNTAVGSGTVARGGLGVAGAGGSSGS